MLLKLYEKNNNPKDLDRIIETLQAGKFFFHPGAAAPRSRCPC